jgi:formylmethanofuran dehydrogenase subunit E
MRTTRRTPAAMLAAAPTALAHDEYEQSVSRTIAIHGIPAPFAVAGYLMGEHALKVLELDRFSSQLDVVHHSPAATPWISVVDGLQAGTGASLAGLNLKTVISKQTYCVIRNRKSGKSIRMTLTPDFVARYAGVAHDKLFQAGLEVAELKTQAVFTAQS